MQDPDAAISDATRALALARPANGHAKSLWRRSQAYDMKGMAKESLMDSIMFVNMLMDSDKGKERKLPYYAARMINKQMTAAGLFAGLASWDKTRKEDHDKKKNAVASSPSGNLSTTIP
ncbi:hypothetical protein GW17_00055293 [Ensete ventricosum]|nr:hypothetical protein GW17_00055293 [Ensete ventricosum]